MTHTTFMAMSKIRTEKGFTLVELLVVFLVIGILASIGSMVYQDIATRTADTQAFTEGKNLLMAASEAFLADEDINFNSEDGMSGPVGVVQYSDGGDRSPIYTLSSRVRARLLGESIPNAGGGFLSFEIWSTGGSVDGDEDSGSGRKEYTFEIVEDDNIVFIPQV